MSLVYICTQENNIKINGVETNVIILIGFNWLRIGSNDGYL
jgi:hypothetical protein